MGETEEGVLLNLSKAEIAERINDKLGFSKREAKELVEDFFSELGDALAAGDAVKLSSFGSFTLRSKSERQGRNPKTREVISICARRVVIFRPAQKLRLRVAKHVGSRD